MQFPQALDHSFKSDGQNKIKSVLFEASQLVDNVLADINSFAQKNKSKIQRYGSDQKKYAENTFQHDFYQSKSYYAFEIKCKDIQKLMKEISNNIHVVDLSSCKSKVQLCSGEIKLCIEYLQQEKSTYQAKKPVMIYSLVGDSYLETFQYIEDLYNKIYKIGQTVMIVKEQISQALSNPGQSTADNMKTSRQENKLDQNKNMDQKTESQNFLFIEQNLDNLKKQISRFCTQCLSFEAKYPVYQDFKARIEELSKMTKVSLKDRQKIKFYKDNSSNEVNHLKQQLVTLRNEFQKNKANNNLASNKLTYFNNVESHMNLLDQYLKEIQQNLTQINVTNLQANFLIKQKQIFQGEKMTSSQHSSPYSTLKNSRASSNENIVNMTKKMNLNEKGSNQKKNHELQKAMHQLMGSASFIHDQLCKLIPKTNYPPHQNTNIVVNHKKMLEIQSQAQKVVDQFSELLMRIHDKSKSQNEADRFQLGDSQSKQLVSKDEHRLKQINVNHQKKVDQLNEEIIRLQQCLKKLEDEQKDKAQSNEKTIVSVLSQNKTLKQQIQKNKEKVDQFDGISQQLKVAQEQNVSLKNQIEILKNQIENSRQKLSQESQHHSNTLNSQIVELKLKVQKLNQSNTDLQQRLTDATKQLKTQVVNLNHQPKLQSVKPSVKKTTSLIYESDHVNKNQHKPKSQIAQKEDEGWQNFTEESLLAKEKQIIENIKTLKEQLSNLETQVSAKQSLLTYLDQQISTKQNAFKESEQKNNELITKNFELEEKNQQIGLKIVSNKNIQSDLNQSIKVANSKLDKLNQQFVQKEKQVLAKSQSLKKLNDQINQKNILSVKIGYQILNLFKSIDVHNVENQVKLTVAKVYKTMKEDFREQAKKWKADKELKSQEQKGRTQLEEQIKKIRSEIRCLSFTSSQSGNLHRSSGKSNGEQDLLWQTNFHKLSKEFVKMKKYFELCFQLILQNIRILKVDEEILVKDETILDTKIGEMKSHLQKLQQETKQFQNQKKQMQKKVQQLSNQCLALGNQKIALNQNIQDIKNQNKKVLNTLVENAGDIFSIKTKYEQSKKKITDFEKKIQGLQDERKKLYTDLVITQKDLQFKTAEYKDKQKQMEVLKKKQINLVELNSRLETQKERLQQGISKLLQEFQSGSGQFRQRQQLSSTLKDEKLSQTDHLIFTLRSLFHQKDKRIAECVHQSTQLNDFKTKSQKLFVKQIQQYKTQMSQFVKKTKSNFDKINERLHAQIKNLWNENQLLKQRLYEVSSCFKQVYILNSKYLKQKSLQNQLDQQLLKSLANSSNYELTKTNLDTIFKSVVCVIYEIETKSSFTNQMAQFYENTMEGYSQVFNQAESLEDLKIKLNSKAEASNNGKFTKLNQAIQKFINQSSKTVKKQIETTKNSFTSELQRMKSKLKQQFSDEVRQRMELKDKEFNKIKQESEASHKQELEVKELMVKSANEQISKLQAQIKDLNKKNKELQSANTNYMQKISQNSQQYWKDLRKKQSQLDAQIHEIQETKNLLQQEVKKLNDELNSSKKSLTIAKNSIQQKDATISSLQIENQDLQRKNNTLKNQTKKLNSDSEYETSKLKDDLAKAKKQIQELKANNNKQKVELMQSAQLKQIKNNLQAKIAELTNEINSLKSSHSKNAAQLNSRVTQLFKQNKKLCDDRQFLKNVLKEIEQTVRLKLNLNDEIQPKKISETIKNFKPVVTIGCKLITSIIIHGYDTQRSDILKKIEDFTLKKIKRTDVMGRFPDKKSLIAEVPRAEAFIMFFKTVSGRVFGTFSQGLKKKTFVFAYWTQKYDRFETLEQESTPVKFFVPSAHITSVASVDLISNRYLEYGNKELRINLMELTSISADSDPTGKKYYNDFQWREIMGESFQESVPLAEVEVHCVQFE